MKKKSHNLSQLAKSAQITTSGGTDQLGFEYRRLGEGHSRGVDMVSLKCGMKRIEVLPTRGMGIWRALNRGIRFGWDSPTTGPVHPNWIPVSEPSGLGWLDGFDEMMVRCGLASNGAPDFDDNHQLVYPLHGRIANLPASEVRVDVDESEGRIAIHGVVNENRFHFQRLQLQTEIALSVDSDEIFIGDQVTNLSERPVSIQLLYHNNFGPPVLENASELHAPISKLVPRNQHAATGIADWSRFGPPDPSFVEQVYFAELAANAENRTLAVLTNSQHSIASTIRYNVTKLPCFSIWKNTVGLADGYVTGLEPGTNFPNPRSFEESHGRVVQLDAGESFSLSLQIGMLVGQSYVDDALDEVDTLRPPNPYIGYDPDENWCAP